jgi:hypothetical protein
VQPADRVLRHVMARRGGRSCRLAGSGRGRRRRGGSCLLSLRLVSCGRSWRAGAGGGRLAGSGRGRRRRGGSCLLSLRLASCGRSWRAGAGGPPAGQVQARPAALRRQLSTACGPRPAAGHGAPGRAGCRLAASRRGRRRSGGSCLLSLRTASCGMSWRAGAGGPPAGQVRARPAAPRRQLSTEPADRVLRQVTARRGGRAAGWPGPGTAGGTAGAAIY